MVRDEFAGPLPAAKPGVLLACRDPDLRRRQGRVGEIVSLRRETAFRRRAAYRALGGRAALQAEDAVVGWYDFANLLSDGVNRKNQCSGASAADQFGSLSRRAGGRREESRKDSSVEAPSGDRWLQTRCVKDVSADVRRLAGSCVPDRDRCLPTLWWKDADSGSADRPGLGSAISGGDGSVGGDPRDRFGTGAAATGIRLLTGAGSPKGEVGASVYLFENTL
jgi:hypothetical protein